MNDLKKTLLACGLSLVLISCGSSDDEEEAAVVISGSLKTSLLASTDVKSTALTSATCVNDVNTGLFTANFGGEGGSKLNIKIKGFTKTGATYACSQASDNADGDVGSKYNICAVDFSIASSVSGADTYNMYRDLEAAPAFTYGGSCNVTTTFEGSKVKLTVSCANLVRTHLQSREVFPVDQTVVGSINGATTAECNI